MGVVKWKTQRGAVGVICLLLIAATQIVRFCTGAHFVKATASYGGTSYRQRAFAFWRPMSGYGGNANISGAPFIQDHISNSIPKSVRDISKPGLLAANFSQDLEIGFHGSYDFFAQNQIETVIRRIIPEWQRMRADLVQRMGDEGYRAISENECFLWLQDCYQLAKNEAILEAVRKIIPGRIALAKMLVGNAQAETTEQMNVSFDGYKCNTAYVVVNIGIRIIINAHKLSERNALHVARMLSNRDPQNSTLEAIKLVKLFLPKDYVGLIRMDSGCYVIHGRSLFALENQGKSQTPFVVLQFSDVDCAIRDNFPTPNFARIESSPSVPAVLLVSGSLQHADARVNDIREEICSGEEVERPYTAISIGDPASSSVVEYVGEGKISVVKRSGYAEVETEGSVLRKIKIQWMKLENRLELVSQEEDSIMVAMEGLMIHHKESKEGKCEKRGGRDVRVGEAIFISKGALHRWASRWNWNAEVMRLRWERKEKGGRLGKKKSVAKGAYMLEMNREAGAVQGRMAVLGSGQAFDPANDSGCDVVVIVVAGWRVEIMPFNIWAQKSEAVVIAGGQSCLLWNAGATPATLMVLHFFSPVPLPVPLHSDASAFFEEAYYRSSGKTL